MVHEKVEAQAGPASGDLRAGAGLAAAGALFLGVDADPALGRAGRGARRRSPSRSWCSAAYLFALRFGPRRARPCRAARALRHFESHPEPVFVTDLDGRLLGAQPGRLRRRLLDGRRRRGDCATG